MTRAMRYALVAGGGIMSILLFLLASASDNSSFFEKNYPWLLGLNALAAVVLLGSVIALLARLYKRYRRGKFGSRLMARLVLLFALMGILPGALIYLVSVQFVSRSIESWFDIRVESALESGLNLGRAALDESLNDLQSKARIVVQELASVPNSELPFRLSRLREQGQIQEATVLNASGRVIATSGSSLSTLLPDVPTAAVLRKARLNRGFAAIEGGTDPGAEFDKNVATAAGQNAGAAQALRLRVVLQLPASASSLSLQNETTFLQLLQPVPAQLAGNAEDLRLAYSEYQQRSLARSGLRKIYIVTLTLTLLLAIFAAIVSAFLIASGLAKPLLLLAEGTRAVAEGDLSPRPIVATPDELGTLTQSFNAMTRQLFDARNAVERNSAALEHAKAYLESVLANMSAGVMVLDTGFRLLSCNASVESILQQQLTASLGQPLSQIDGLTAFSSAVIQAFSKQSAQTAAGDGAEGKLHWQQQIEIPRRPNGAEIDHAITLLARGSNLPLDKGNGYVVVFDDISDVISAQRSLAWGEVARRLAHEIKNPLTPIQLSAERLQMKLHGKLSAEDAALLDKGTATIVNQVTSMKHMVDSFRDYARTPPAVLAPLDLNALIRETLQLYLSNDASDTIHLSLGADVPELMADKTQLRQVVHNLLQNAQDAVNEHTSQSNPGDPVPRIDVRTETIYYPGDDGGTRTAVRLSITDNGSGFSPRILASAFEPYVTSKPRGTGLGLAMVKKIVDEHGGRIDIQNRADSSGATIRIVLLKLVDKSAEKTSLLLP
ncbi:MAG: PAS domain-containing sensor histidine kinase [Glaciimonas sp.]|nr:PAS domain-containing sensor histidine kinase [Glaciimonas sp.]